MRDVLPVKVLYVEDDRGCRDAMTLFFAATCEKTVSAENGREALDLLAMELPDVVVTDLDMPEMDGLTFIAQMREKGIRVPTIIFSGSIDTEVRMDAAGLGVVDCVDKPCALPELLAKIAAAVFVGDRQSLQPQPLAAAT